MLAVVLGALEKWRPVEVWADRRPVRVDVIYTLLVRLGVLPLAIFFLLLPLVDGLDGWLRLHGFIPPKLEDAFPALFAHPFVSFLAYLVILDFVLYWLHRAQHGFGFWWALHALHHSQREMTFWTDDRNHLLDMVLTDACSPSWRSPSASRRGSSSRSSRCRARSRASPTPTCACRSGGWASGCW